MLFATTVLAALLVPAISVQAPLSLFGGVLAVVYLLALGRFFWPQADSTPGVPSAVWEAAAR